MSKQPSVAFALALALAGTLACGEEASGPSPATGGAAGAAGAGGSGGQAGFSLDTYPAVDGSTSTLPLARVIACELLGLPYAWEPYFNEDGTSELLPVATTPEEQALRDGILAKVVHNRTHQAYLNLIGGSADLILVANPPSPEERAAADAAGVTFELAPVAQDALVVLVNEANPLTDLTTAQIRGIFLGELTDWSEVGGAAGEIHPFVRPVNSGSQQLFDTIVMEGQALPAWPEDRRPALMGALIDEIKADPLAIGYSVYYYVTFQYPGTGYHATAVDGIRPTAASIAGATYPFGAPVLMVTRADLDPGGSARALHDWLLTPDGQRTVSHSGYVPALQE